MCHVSDTKTQGLSPKFWVFAEGVVLSLQKLLKVQRGSEHRKDLWLMSARKCRTTIRRGNLEEV